MNEISNENGELQGGKLVVPTKLCSGRPIGPSVGGLNIRRDKPVLLLFSSLRQNTRGCHSVAAFAWGILKDFLAPQMLCLPTPRWILIENE
jgi:hypothetical protein